MDAGMFQPAPLHPYVLQADVFRLPFPEGEFDVDAASNLLFLLAQHAAALVELRRVLCPGGRLCLLNPSEEMSMRAAGQLADQRGLEGLARDTLLNWAARAEAHARWDAVQLTGLLERAGLKLERTELRVGPGLARLACATRV